MGCAEREHDWLGAATAQVQAPPDTTGWGATLRGMQGIWLARNYAERLHAQRSIVAADALADPVLGILNIHTALFRGDSLPVASMHTASAPLVHGAFLFQLDTTNSKGRVRLVSRQPVLEDVSRITLADFEQVGATRLLLLRHQYEGRNIKDYYVCVTTDVPPRTYSYDPLWGISRHMEKLLHGHYEVFTPKGEVLPWEIELRPGGDMGHPEWDRYRWTLIDGRDALEFQRMARTAVEPPQVLRFEIVMPRPDVIELYAWEQKGRRKSLRYRLRRLPMAGKPPP